MKNCALILATVFAVLSSSANAYAPQSRSKVTPVKPLANIKKAVASTFVAATIASNAILPMGAADAADYANFNLDVGNSNIIIAEKVVKEGLYQDYEIEVTPQAVDRADSSFKSAKETKSKKGKYTALLAVLIVGSFIIPMAQYFWYVRDDDSTEQFFGQKKAPEPEPEPVKKKGWF